MPNSENPATSSIETDFPIPVVYPDYLQDALARGQTNDIYKALHEIRNAMQDGPARKVCDFDLSLNDVLRVLKDARFSSPLDS